MPRPVDARPWFLLATLLPALAQALPEDRQKPVQVTADSARLNEATGEATYRGNVLTRQGTLEIRGDLLTLKVGQGGELQSVLTRGKPARLQQQVTADKGLAQAQAEDIQYDSRSGIVILTGNASLKQDGATFSGPRIVYSTLKRQVEASGNTTQRVQLVFPPSELNSKKPVSGGKP